jgi:3-hydroxyacyl-CoA dehydrogenase
LNESVLVTVCGVRNTGRVPLTLLLPSSPLSSCGVTDVPMQAHMSNPVVYRTTDEVALIEVDNPPVNALSPGVPDAIIEALDRAERDASVRAIVFKGAGKTFVAGADISSLEQAAWGDASAACDLHDLLARIEDCPKPVVMAIHGTALGGGLELAMAGHFRVASRDALVGQPEVNLGIIPGAEGTQRLPRLVGIARALDMCVTGKPIKAPEALAAGLIDAIAEGDLATDAIAFARTTTGAGAAVKTRDRHDRLGAPDENGPLFAAARELAAKTCRPSQSRALRLSARVRWAAALRWPARTPVCL